MTQLVDAPAADPPPAGSAVAESPFIVRVAGLPVSALTGLSAPDLLTAIRRVLAEDGWLAAEGRALADELHAVIGALTGPEHKPGLVGLRRSLFRGRAPRAREWSAPLRAALPAGLAGRIERWAGRLAERDRSAGALAGTVEHEARRTTRALLDAVADPGFRHGVAQSSPDLSAELEKWLARKDSHPPGQVIIRLARYLSRAAAKTSPYSTFTTVGAGTWTDSSGRLTVHRGPVPHGMLEYHGSLLAELERLVSTSDELRPVLVVRANPSLTRLGNRFAALGSPPREEVVSVAAVGEVTNCLRVLGDGWQPLGELRDRLADGAPVAKIDAFLDRLIEIGVLELRVPVDDQCPDKFGALAEWLSRHGGQPWSGVAECCATLSRLLGEPTDLGEVDGHRRRLSAVRQAIGRLRARAGLPAEDTDFLHEHTVFAEPVATASRSAWRAALNDLDLVRRWLAPHDPGLPLRLALGAYCAATFGPGSTVPFLAMHRRLLEDLSAPGGSAIADIRTLLRPRPSTSDYQLPVLRELAALARRSVDDLTATAPDADGVIRVAPNRLAAAGLPDYVRPVESVTWFVQADGPRLVLNTAMSGLGRGRSRALHLIARSGGGRLPPQLEPSTSDTPGYGAVADSCGAFGHTLNVRRPVRGGHELDYPFTVGRGECRPRIPPADLVIEHDEPTGLARLRRASTGCLVTPAHLGMMTELMLPFGLQLLVRGLGASPTLFPPGGLLAARPAGDGDEEVRHSPRVEAGLIVLRRATWSVPGDAVVQRAPGESDAGLLLRLHGWLAAQGIPDRCFVRADAPSDPDWLRSTFTKTRKPLYVDFSSPLLVAMFERLVAGPVRRVEFREALPRIADSPGDPRVTELVIETTAGVR